VSNGGWCPYCSYPPKKICNDNECQYCFNKSFASHSKALFWSDKNEKKPRECFKFSDNKYWFNCERCDHAFESTLSHVSNGTWCTYCHLKTETKLYDYLVSHFPVIQRQFNPDWCINSKTGRYLPFDFVIDQFHLIIELDGGQHFDQVSNWDSPLNTQTKDKYKMYCAWNNGYSVIRLLQTEVLNDQINLDMELLPLIHQYEQPSLYCLYNSDKDKHNIYCLYYEEYMLNPSIEPYTSDDETEDK
jgi:very-short-patch-repair endonuclease